jgi:UDP-N-acetylglucosamine acyltransferase
MSGKIHPTAIVEPGAQLGEDVHVGACAYVGPEVTLGDGCFLHHHATVDGLTTVGTGCEFFPYSCVGLKTQDLKFKGGKPGTKIGSNNVFREFVTVHAATDDGDSTVIGNHNYFLAYGHIAHDCTIGSHVVASNNATFAGHVTIGDRVVIGGLAAIHQFCRIGEYAMVGGLSKIVQDVPPFVIGEGNPASIRSLNKVALQRAGYSGERLEIVKSIYRIIYRSGLNRTQALEELEKRDDAASADVRLMIEFIKASERGLCPGSSAA